jgi:hypothetical protein
VIYDKILYSCSGSDIPSSDTSEKNYCCKGTLTTKEGQQNVNWYDLLGNKLSGAAKGDIVKCIGISYNPGKYNLTITLSGRIINQSMAIPIDSTKRAELGPITLSETGTYQCEGVFYASPAVTHSSYLRVSDNSESRLFVLASPLLIIPISEIKLVKKLLFPNA